MSRSAATLTAAEQDYLLQHAPQLCRLLYHAADAAPAAVAAELDRLTAGSTLTPGQARRAAAFFRARRGAALLRRYRAAHPKRRIYNAAAFAEEE